MATYEYSGYRSDGAPCRGRVDAGSSKQAIRDLLATGVYVESIHPMRSDSRLGVRQRSSLYRELGALLGAGLALDRAIELMRETDDAAMSTALLSIGAKIHEGRSLADSMAEACKDVKSFEMAAIMSAERSATLPAMLSRMADMLDVQEGVRDRVRSALIYPAFVLCLGVFVAFFMLGVIVPKTEAMLTASGLELPGASAAIVLAAKIVAVAVGAAAAMVAVLFAVARKRAAADSDFAVRLDKFILRLPFMRTARGLAGMRFASILSVLTESGMTAVSALPVAGAGTGRPWLEKCVAEQAERVRNGASLSAAISALPLIGGELAGWVRVGEAGGCLGAMLDVAAARLQRDWDRTLSRRLALLEPAMLAAVGLFVLVVALALIVPVIGLTRTLSGG